MAAIRQLRDDPERRVRLASFHLLVGTAHVTPRQYGGTTSLTSMSRPRR